MKTTNRLLYSLFIRCLSNCLSSLVSSAKLQFVAVVPNWLIVSLLGILRENCNLLVYCLSMATISKESTHLQRSISDPVLPDELVWEILTWLPVKSLMRFKCVSKLWLSVILEPAFATRHRHRGAFRGLLIFGSSMRRRHPKDFYFYLRLDSPVKEISHHLTLGHDGTHMGYTDPVNGMVCFYYRNRSFLYNLATRERLQLPDSRCEAHACSYHLGFDPVNNLYKLVKICPLYINYDDLDPWADEELAVFVRNVDCEILTIGESVKDSPFIWRSIDSPPWDTRSRGVCYDGVLYWCEPRRLSRSMENDNYLIAFDLYKESFFLFPRPSVGFYLMPFGSCLCLLRVIADGDPRYLAKIVFYRGGGIVPTELDIRVDGEFSPIGLLPNGKILFRDQFPEELTFPPAFCLYDLKKREFEKIVLPQVTPSTFTESTCPNHVRSLIECGDMSYFEENILSLRRWTSHSHP